ncbi:hypothetical protein ACFL02_08380 [Planctomycetota bacterium]
MSREKIKNEVLRRIAKGYLVRSIGRAKWRIGDHILHVRYCGKPTGQSMRYAYGINPTTLKADFEIWICGKANYYYLIPTKVMKKIYNDPNAYIDSHHPEIRIAKVDAQNHLCYYSRGAKFMDFSEYFYATL